MTRKTHSASGNDLLRPVPEALLFGLIGHPLGHTLSPEIHNPLFRKYAINAHYLVLDTPPAKFSRVFIRELKASGFRGFNITLPYKRKIMDYLDDCDSQAEKIGAVNTVVSKNGRFVGYNTDDPGFSQSLASCFPGFRLKGKNVLIIGAGGAAFGAAGACLSRGCGRLVIANRTPSRAATLIKNLKKTGRSGDISLFPLTRDLIAKLPASLKPGLVVNAASYGLKKEKKSLLDFKGVDRETRVMDLIYNPSPTAFLSGARKAGLPAADGLSMLVHQGLLAFRLWTGVLPEYAPVERRLRRLLSSRF